MRRCFVFKTKDSNQDLASRQHTLQYWAKGGDIPSRNRILGFVINAIPTLVLLACTTSLMSNIYICKSKFLCIYISIYHRRQSNRPTAEEHILKLMSFWQKSTAPHINHAQMCASLFQSV